MQQRKPELLQKLSKRSIVIGRIIAEHTEIRTIVRVILGGIQQEPNKLQNRDNQGAESDRAEGNSRGADECGRCWVLRLDTVPWDQRTWKRGYKATSAHHQAVLLRTKVIPPCSIQPEAPRQHPLSQWMGSRGSPPKGPPATVARHTFPIT